MTKLMKSNLQQLEEIVRGILPETMELTMGCKVRNNHASDDNPHKIGSFVRRCIRNRNKCFELMDDEGKLYWIFESNATTGEVVLEILGIPLQLHHVLCAVDKKSKYVLVDSTGTFWNLSQPLSNQSAPTIDFLLGILTK